MCTMFHVHTIFLIMCSYYTLLSHTPTWEKEKWKVCVIETHTSSLFTSIFALYFWFKVCSNNTLLISMCVGEKRKAQYLMCVYLIQLCCILYRLFFWCLCMHFDQVLVAVKCSWFLLNCTWWHRKFPLSCFYTALATDLPPMGTLTRCSSVMLSCKKKKIIFLLLFHLTVLFCNVWDCHFLTLFFLSVLWSRFSLSGWSEAGFGSLGRQV